MEPRHSGIGIASFILSLAMGALLFLLLIVAGVMESSSPGGIDEESPEAVGLGLLLIGSFIAQLVAAGLAIGGLCQRDRKKIFAVLGLVFSLLAVFGLTGIVLLGLAMG